MIVAGNSLIDIPIFKNKCKCIKAQKRFWKIENIYFPCLLVFCAHFIYIYMFVCQA